MTKKDLVDYLFYSVELEQKKYELEQLTTKLYYKIDEYSRQFYTDEKKYVEVKAYHKVKIWPFIKWSIIICWVPFNITARLIFEILDADVGSEYWIRCMKFLPIQLLILLLCIRVAYAAVDEGISKRQAKKWSKEKYARIQEENEKIQKRNEIIKNNKQHLSVYKNEYDILNQEYERTKNNLSILYSLDVIYPKYRRLVPVCSFYEYLCSGRCNKLEGHEGAYNIYEMELRQNIIIAKLDSIIYKLDQIKENQYILYTKLNDINKSVSLMYNTVTDQLDNIETNSYIMTYNSYIAAKNTEFLKWFNIFSNRNKS